MDAAGQTVLFVRVPAVDPSIDASWQTWYDQVHIEYRMRMPGFLSARRYRVDAGVQRCFVLYEMTSVEAMTSPPYLEHRRWEYAQPATSFEAIGPKLPGFERGVYESRGSTGESASALDAPFVYIAGHDPDPSEEKAFDVWFRDEHEPRIRRTRGVTTIRRFAMTQAALGAKSGLRTESPQRFAAYYLDAGAGDAAAFQRDVRESWKRSPRGVAPTFEMLGACIYTTYATAPDGARAATP